MDLGRTYGGLTRLLLYGYFPFFEEACSYPPRGSFSRKEYCLTHTRPSLCFTPTLPKRLGGAEV